MQARAVIAPSVCFVVVVVPVAVVVAAVRLVGRVAGAELIVDCLWWEAPAWGKVGQ